MRAIRAWPLSLLLAAGMVEAFIPAPPQIIKCPGSEEVRQVPGWRSGNTFGRELWTDGYVLAPMMPSFPQISRCGNAGPMFWVEDLPKLGEVPFSPDSEQARALPAEWLKAPAVRRLTETEFLDAIDQGLGTTLERLLHLRLHAWWLANQALRFPRSDGPVPRSSLDTDSRARANLTALVDMLDGPEEGRLQMKVEALRELGRRTEAQTLIERAPPQPKGVLAAWLEQLQVLVRGGTTQVVKVVDPPKP